MTDRCTSKECHDSGGLTVIDGCLGHPSDHPTSPLLAGRRWACSRSLLGSGFFGTLIMTYVYFLRQTTHGEPNPSQVFRLPLVLAASACLFSSSATIHLAEQALRRNARRAFLGWWGLTIVLGVLVPAGHGDGVERPDRQVGLDHQPQSVRHHVFHSGRFSRLARDHRRDRHEHRVRPGVAPADHGAERRPAWKSSPGTGISWMAFGLVVFTLVYVVGR